MTREASGDHRPLGTTAEAYDSMVSVLAGVISQMAPNVLQGQR